MSTQTSVGLAIGPLFVLVLIAVVVALIFSRSGRRGAIVLLAGLVGLGVLGAFVGLFHARSVVRNDLVSDHMNSYPLAVRESVRGVEEARRSVEAARDSIARQQAEMQAKARGAYAEARVDFPAAGVATAVDLLPSEPWKSVAELGFEADVHASAAAAAETLVVQILKAKDVSYPDVRIERVQVWTGPEIGGEVLSRAISCLQRKQPEWAVLAEAVAPEQPLEATDAGAAAMHFELLNPSRTHQAPWDANRVQHGGVLRVRLTWPGGRLDRSTQFVEKPWVENASEFASAKPEMRWVVGCSSSDAADVLAARREAMQAAARQLVPETQARVRRSASAPLGLDERWLASQIEQELMRSSCVRDQFTQTLITPSGGQVTRLAVLVQSPAVVQRVAASCTATVQHDRKTWFAVVFSAVGMLVLICVVGLLLNSFTKGYYRGRIVVVAGLVIVLGALLFFKFAASAHYPANARVVVGYSADSVEQPRLAGY